MFHTTPKDITVEVERFCRSITTQHAPVFIEVEASDFAVSQMCFSNVLGRVAAEGGSIIYGWLIWYREGIFIEAENHAVWMDQSGKLVDFTSPPSGETTVLFLRDDSATPYPQIALNSHRKALNKDPLVKRFVELADLNGAANVDWSRTGKIPSAHIQKKIINFPATEKRLHEKYGFI